MATIATTKPRRSGGGIGRDFGGRGDGGGRSGPRRQPDNLRLGMFFALAGVFMLFVAMTSSYVIRRGLGADWNALAMPRVLWFNTAVLLASSAALEQARRRLSGRWIGIALGLGALFVAGQLVAWSALAAQGIYIDTNPHSSFFYTLTGLHGLHVLGGLAALAWLSVRRPVSAPALGAMSMYWHFMGGLWLYLVVLLFGRF